MSFKRSHHVLFNKQDLIRVTDLKDRTLAEHNFERVNFMSIVYLIVLVVSGLAQVRVFSHLFEADLFSFTYFTFLKILNFGITAQANCPLKWSQKGLIIYKHSWPLWYRIKYLLMKWLEFQVHIIPGTLGHEISLNVLGAKPIHFFI